MKSLPTDCTYQRENDGGKGWCPEFTKKGDSQAEDWWDLFIANWHGGKNSSQSDCLWITTKQMQSSITRFTCSVSPSVCGWLEVVICNFTPIRENTSLKRGAVNRGSQSKKGNNTHIWPMRGEDVFNVQLSCPFCMNRWSGMNEVQITSQAIYECEHRAIHHRS